MGKEKSICPSMKVHRVKAGRVTETVYLGDIIREDGKTKQTSKMPQSGVGSMQGPSKVVFYLRLSTSVGCL